MATVTAASNSLGVVNFASGSFTSDNTITTINLGFVPRSVKVINSTDAIVWEKIEGMTAANTLKLVSHASAQVNIDTGSAVVINTDGTVTLAQATVGSSKAIAWVAFG